MRGSQALIATDKRRSSIFDVANRQRGSILNSSSACVFSSRPSLAQPAKLVRVLHENTYKLEPDERFDPAKAKSVLDEVLQRYFDGMEYDPIHIGSTCRDVSQAIVDRMKILDLKRFRFVASVVAGENKGQGIKVVSRYLWDHKRDNWVQSVFTNSSMFVTATLYAVYFE